VSTDHRSNEQPREGFCVHYDRDGKLTYVDLPLDFDESDRAVLNEILISPQGTAATSVAYPPSR
jgi:hypothetical protein